MDNHDNMSKVAITGVVDSNGDYAVANIKNADKIRAMSDAELAKTFAKLCAGRECSGEKSCYQCWLDWLKQEVE